MKIGKSQLEHQSEIVTRMSEHLAKRFFKYADKNKDELVDKTLIDLSKSIGYLTIVNNSVVKTIKHEKRLEAIEEKLKLNMAIPMRMFEEPQMEKYR